MLRIYEWNETGFTRNGLAVLVNASDVCVRRAINGDCTLTFKLPAGDENWKYVLEERVVTLEGQRYRIKHIKGREITAYPVYQDACGKHIQSTGDMIGKTVPEIMTALFAGTDVVMANDADLAVLGMEWVKDKTDFIDQSKVTPIGALKTLMEQLDKYKIHNELYIDNNRIALVRQIGKDRGAKIDLRLNAEKIEPVRDTSEMITRLYPYGKDERHIGSVNGGYQYIDSPNIGFFPLHEGYMSFDDIEDPEELLKAAQAQFEPENPDRIDAPKYSLEVSSFAEVGGVPIGLGDLVEVNDPQYGMKTRQRVISEEYYPFEPNRRRITVGQPEKSVSDIFDGVVSSASRYDSSTNSRGEVKTAWLENLKESYKTYINNSLDANEKENRRTVIHDYGDIWVNPDNPEQALAIVGGVLAMANGKYKADDQEVKDGKATAGDYKWNAFGDWSGFTADVINAGILNTSLVNILGSDGRLKIADNLLTIEDGLGRPRLQAGLVNGGYVFRLYDADGAEALTLTETGAIELIGTVYTGDETGRVVISGSGIQTSAGNILNGFNTGVYADGSGAFAEIDHDGQSGIKAEVTKPGTKIKATLYGPDASFLELSGTTAKPVGDWDFSGLGGVTGDFWATTGANGTGRNVHVWVTNGIVTKIAQA